MLLLHPNEAVSSDRLIDELWGESAPATSNKAVQTSASQAAADAPEVTINYGAFINTVMDFLIVAFSIFIVVKFINELRKKPA